MKYRWWFFALSAVVIIPGLISLAVFGLRLGVDFTGGSLLEVKFLQPTATVESSQIRSIAEKLLSINAVQPTGDQVFQIKASPMDNGVKEVLVQELQTTYGPVQVERFETVGPILGEELVRKTVIAVILAASGITLYLARQFKEWKYGICAVLAMFHDTLVLLGIFSILGKTMGIEVDVLFVTALLTTLSFSVHDTIVVFHRILDFRQVHRTTKLEVLINAAIWQTLSRSLNNSLTIILMLVTLFILGGETIRYFALALLIGAITGTYSSTFTAAPLLLVWENIAQKRHAKLRLGK